MFGNIKFFGILAVLALRSAILKNMSNLQYHEHLCFNCVNNLYMRCLFDGKKPSVQVCILIFLLVFENMGSQIVDYSLKGGM